MVIVGNDLENMVEVKGITGRYEGGDQNCSATCACDQTLEKGAARRRDLCGWYIQGCKFLKLVSVPAPAFRVLFTTVPRSNPRWLFLSAAMAAPGGGSPTTATAALSAAARRARGAVFTVPQTRTRGAELGLGGRPRRQD